MIDKSYYRDLTKMNTFRMKVTARNFIEYDSVADLVEIGRASCRERVSSPV